MPKVMLVFTVEAGYLELSRETKDNSKQQEFEIADSKWLKSKSKEIVTSRNNEEFEITEFQLVRYNYSWRLSRYFSFTVMYVHVAEKISG